jgi:molybdopterin converting factor small subunit
MQIRVLFFGATADETGKRVENFVLGDSTNVEQALDELFGQFPKLCNHKLRFAVNQEYVSKDRSLNEGDELAIFTAVSGG